MAESIIIPKDYVLQQNFPNPFNPATTIRYGLPKESDVTLCVYNVIGEEVSTLIDNEKRTAGYHAVVWDGRNDQGRLVSNGIYIYRLRSGSHTMVKKMVFVK